MNPLGTVPVPASACLVWNPDPTVFSWGGLTMDWYGVTFGVALFSSFFLARWQMMRSGVKEEHAVALLGYLFIGMVVGAYVGNRLFGSWWELLRDLYRLITFQGRLHGFFSYGAVLGMALVLLWFMRRHRYPLLAVTDALVFPMALMVFFVRLGNLVNSEAYGVPSDGVAWAFCFPRADGGMWVPRHPYQLYEAVGVALLLGGLLWADRRLGGAARPVGMLSALAGLGYGSLRFVLEFWREMLRLDLHFLQLTPGQTASLPFLLVSYWILQWARANRRGGRE